MYHLSRRGGVPAKPAKTPWIWHWIITAMNHWESQSQQIYWWSLGHVEFKTWNDFYSRLNIAQTQNLGQAASSVRTEERIWEKIDNWKINMWLVVLHERGALLVHNKRHHGAMMQDLQICPFLHRLCQLIPVMQSAYPFEKSMSSSSQKVSS